MYYPFEKALTELASFIKKAGILLPIKPLFAISLL
jgi:hypothetical protein